MFLDTLATQLQWIAMSPSASRSYTVVKTIISRKPLDAFMKFGPDVHDSRTTNPSDLSSRGTMRMIFLILGAVSQQLYRLPWHMFPFPLGSILNSLVWSTDISSFDISKSQLVWSTAKSQQRNDIVGLFLWLMCNVKDNKHGNHYTY